MSVGVAQAGAKEVFGKMEMEKLREALMDGAPQRAIKNFTENVESGQIKLVEYSPKELIDLFNARKLIFREDVLEKTGIVLSPNFNPIDSILLCQPIIFIKIESNILIMNGNHRTAGVMLQKEKFLYAMEFGSKEAFENSMECPLSSSCLNLLSNFREPKVLTPQEMDLKERGFPAYGTCLGELFRV